MRETRRLRSRSVEPNQKAEVSQQTAGELSVFDRARFAPPPWLPNGLTLLRVALIPAFLVHANWCVEAVARGEAGLSQRALAGAALIGIGVSDVIDGWLARRFDLATQLGAILDAVADKLAQFSLLLFFAQADGLAFVRIPVWFVALVLGRDVLLALGSLAVRLRRGKVEVVHEPHGKLASLLLFVLLLWVTADLPRAPILPALVAIGLFVTLSTYNYVRAGWRQWVAHATHSA